MRATTWILLCLAGIGAPAGAPAWDCDSRDAVLEVRPGDRLEVDAVAGSLDIRGREGLDSVTVRGEACASSERLLEKVRLRTERSGDRIQIHAEVPNHRAVLWWSRYARLDLTLEIPSDLPVKVRDSSGDLDIGGVDSLELCDSSGGIRVYDVARDVSIRDGSGEIRVADIGGSVLVEDGSGDIEVDGAGGDVLIPRDGSGNIEIRDVGGDVRIRDGSGQILVRGVDGSVTVDEDGSGSIDVAIVGEDVLVRRDGSGTIVVHDVRGDFEVIDDGSGGIDHGGVEGRVRLPRRRR